MNSDQQHQAQMEKAYNQIRFSPLFSFPAESKESNLDAFKHLKQSLEAGGATFKAFALHHPEGGHRGLVASEEFFEGDIIMSIPLKLTLKATRTSQLEISDKALQKPDRMFNMSGASKNDLFDFISLEPEQTEDAYQGYIHLLPNAYTDYPMFFNSHFLQHTGFGQHLSGITDALKIDYISLIAEGKTNIPIDIFLWNYMSLQSRFFNFKEDRYMVPMLDLCNHSNERLNCKFRFDKETETIHYFALTHIQKGEELIFSYNLKLCPMRSLIFYNIFPEDVIIKDRNLVYYYHDNKKYNFGVNTPQSIVDLITEVQNQSQQTLENIYSSLALQFATLISDRKSSQAQSMQSSSSDWEKKVIQFTYDQEIKEYTKAQSIIEALQKSKFSTEMPSIEALSSLYACL